MKRYLWALCGVSLACGAGAMAACSGDDNGSPGTDAGPDSSSTPDATTDSPAQGMEAAAMMEAAPGKDGTSGQDAGPDTGTGTPDATPDAPADASMCALFDGSLDPNLVDAGRQIVTQFRCYGCHQSTALDAGGIVLSGNSNSISDAAAIYPPNLTPDPATGLGCWTDPQIQRAFLDGIDDKDAALCVMPHFRAKFVEAGLDVDASATELVEFLRSLNAVSHQVPETMCPPPAEAGAPSDAGDAQAEAGEAAAPADAGDASAD